MGDWTPSDGSCGWQLMAAATVLKRIVTSDPGSLQVPRPQSRPRRSIDLVRRAAADARRRAAEAPPGGSERPRRHSYDDGARLQ